MFRSIFTSLSICLQGTVFERRPKVKAKSEHDECQSHSHETDEEEYPPYLIMMDASAVKKDLISRMHGAGSRSVVRRTEGKEGRQKWCRNSNEQPYVEARAKVDPKVEVYWKALGLGSAQEHQEYDW
jgi:hypothetical protein